MYCKKELKRNFTFEDGQNNQENYSNNLQKTGWARSKPAALSGAARHGIRAVCLPIRMKDELWWRERRQHIQHSHISSQFFLISQQIFRGGDNCVETRQDYIKVINIIKNKYLINVKNSANSWHARIPPYLVSEHQRLKSTYIFTNTNKRTFNLHLKNDSSSLNYFISRA